MGGWCVLRDKCEHYLNEAAFVPNPAERLCEPGAERAMFFIPVVPHKEVEVV
jgi:hypothetical protein